MIRHPWTLILIVVVLVTGLTACSKAEESRTPTPDQDSIEAASTLFAQPTRVVGSAPTATPMNQAELELSRLVAQMEQAVLAGDHDAYMTHIWDGDPVFKNDHEQWALDWQAHPLKAFEIRLNGVQATSPTTATARMTMIWTQAVDIEAGSSGGTTISAIFFKEGDTWFFAGEDWKMLEVDTIRLYYFADASVNYEAQAAVIGDYLPSIVTRLTREFDITFEQPIYLRLYENPPMLQTMTRLSMPEINVWNEPGESIKMTLTAYNTAPNEPDVSRELTRLVLYDMGSGTHGNFPWWLEDGIAEYGADLLRTFSQHSRSLKQIAALAFAPDDADQHLVGWDRLAREASLTPGEHTTAIYQTATLLHFITEQYGSTTRNAWIRAIATDQTLDDACQDHLGASFDDLTTQWFDWLLTYR
ncbi:MAG: hypothetical protein JW966_02890 [Anaerolineae bacterium]|nr:hypothetical protein [Anaerolineae bacterium]